MADGKVFGRVVDASGKTIAGASVTVYETGTTNVATLRDDAGDPLANPLTSDANGEFEYNADSAVYDHLYVFNGVTIGTQTRVQCVNAEFWS